MNTVNDAIFAALASPGNRVAVHNVQLIEVQQGEDGYERITINHAGMTRELAAATRWDEKLSKRAEGRFGQLVSASANFYDDSRPVGSCVFREYLDQSLRRVPELDRTFHPSDGLEHEVIGWVCDAKPQGFRAPVGIIPGVNGEFVPDRTIPVALRVPPEFLDQCKRARMTPAQLLRDFIGDLCEINNYVACPRADRYGSNGSDERMMANAWFERSFGGNLLDPYEVAQLEDDRLERELWHDDLAAILDDFIDSGGSASELTSKVQELAEALAGNKQSKGESC